MKTIGIFYGSSTGTTEGIAKRIAEKLGVEDKDIHDVSNASPADVAPYEILLLGCSTWGAGDLQDDWDSYLGKLKKLDLSEKTVALFGCGDSASLATLSVTPSVRSIPTCEIQVANSLAL